MLPQKHGRMQAGYFYYRVRAYLSQKFEQEAYDDVKEDHTFFKDLDYGYKRKLGIGIREAE